MRNPQTTLEIRVYKGRSDMECLDRGENGPSLDVLRGEWCKAFTRHARDAGHCATFVGWDSLTGTTFLIRDAVHGNLFDFRDDARGDRGRVRVDFPSFKEISNVIIGNMAEDHEVDDQGDLLETYSARAAQCAEAYLICEIHRLSELTVKASEAADLACAKLCEQEDSE